METATKKTQDKLSDAHLWQERYLTVNIQLHEAILAHAKREEQLFKAQIASEYGLTSEDAVDLTTGNITRQASEAAPS